MDQRQLLFGKFILLNLDTAESGIKIYKLDMMTRNAKKNQYNM